MKKGFLYILLLISTSVFFSGCIKNGTERTIDPNMTATMGSYTFSANYVVPATIKPQLSDSSTTLVITGTDNVTGNIIKLSVLKYTNSPGTYSIINRESAAVLVKNGVDDIGSSGLVAIKDVSSNIITGYFSFVTQSGIAITNGTFVVGKPWVY